MVEKASSLAWQWRMVSSLISQKFQDFVIEFAIDKSWHQPCFIFPRGMNEECHQTNW